MKISLPSKSPSLANYFNLKGKAMVQVLVAYEDFACCLRAKDLLGRLSSRLQGEFEIVSDVWKFDWLRVQPFRERAAHEAAAADMIIISTYDNGELSGETKRWIETWASPRRNRRALVALFDAEHQEPANPPPLFAYLRPIAQRANMDFFGKTGDWQREDFEDTLQAIQRTANGAVIEGGNVLADHRSSRGWGINE